MSRVLGEVAGRVGEEVQVERGPLGPVQFWRGQSRYLVGELLDSWVETPPWWQRDAAVPGGASAELVATREVWRVEAVRAGRSADELRRRVRPVLGRRRQPLVARAGARLMGAVRAVPAGQLPLPPALPAAAAQLLDQARRGLAEAAATPIPGSGTPRRTWLRCAAAAAVLAARTRPEPARRRPRSAWVLLGQVAPELGEWATFFAAGAAKRAAAEAGLSHAVTEREADDLVRDVGAFLAVVENCLATGSRCPSRPRAVARLGRSSATAAHRRRPGPRSSAGGA